MNIEKYKNQLNKIFNENGVEFAYLFGSLAYQNFTLQSDVDLAVYLDEKTVKDFFDKRLDLIKETSQLFKRDSDIVILNTAPIFLKYVIIKEGKLIFNKNDSRRIDFELKSLNDYFDYMPTLKIYNERILSKI